jgi:hypothetical protein
MTIRADGGWLNPDGTLNYNLDWSYDGTPPIEELRDVARRYPALFALDGTPTYEGEVRDASRDGVPEFLWATLLVPVRPDEQFPRSGIQVNSGHHRPSDPAHAVFWPLLNRPDDAQGSNYFDTPIFLQLDWQTGAIQGFRFAGYPIEEGYHVNSLNRLQSGKVNVLSFENPMAYYDLAADRDGRPELFIRFAYTPVADPYYAASGPTKSPIEMVQYSWNQTNAADLRWDYKVDVAGLNAIETTVSLGDLVVQQVPHEALPRWVVDHPWAYGTFVAYESGAGYRSSEGLYEWSTLEGVDDYTNTNISDMGYFHTSTTRQREYITGGDKRSPGELYNSMRAGFRGEFADLGSAAALYFSPVDARLHLVGASRGVYNVDNNRRVEYRTLGDGEAIDSWRLYVGEAAVGQLVQARDFLIYGTAGQVRLRQATVLAESFRTTPPTDHDEWARLGARLEANRRDFAADDLGAMYGQFGGPELAISGAQLSDYRPLAGGGFRFVLDLAPGFRTDGTALLNLGGQEPGRYVVTYDGRFTIARLTVPLLSASLADPTLGQLEQNALVLTVRNDGLEDVPQATLELWATPPQGAPVKIAAQPLVLLGSDSTTTTIPWAPTVAGRFTLTPRIRAPGREEASLPAITVTVLPARTASVAAVLGVSGTFWQLLLAFAGLAGLALAATLAFRRGWQPPAVGVRAGAPPAARSRLNGRE